MRVHDARCRRRRLRRTPPGWLIAGKTFRRWLLLRHKNANFPATASGLFPAALLLLPPRAQHNPDRSPRFRRAPVLYRAPCAGAPPQASGSALDWACPWAFPDETPELAAHRDVARI